jgi:ABC-2 type transport system permease protein
MLNYMRSEFFRIFHSKVIYIMMAVLVGISLLVNGVLTIFLHVTEGFRYGTFRFSLNTLTSSLFYMLVVAAAVAWILFSSEMKNRVLHNTVAYGISRDRILLGKCIVGLAVCLILLAVLLVSYVGSAYLFLDEPEWLPLRELLTGILSMSLCAVSAMVFMIVLHLLCQKESYAVLWWILIFVLIPFACMLLGMKVDVFHRLASWMPFSLLKMDAGISFSDYQCLWDTAAGFARCLISGIAGILILGGFGIWRFRKTDM